MDAGISRAEAAELLKKYNKEPFHILHGLTVEGVMRWYAEELGYGGEKDFWGLVGLLHDIDFELYPEEHCLKAPELLREAGISEELIHGVVSHGYGHRVEVKPEHEMEKVLYAADELTGLIWAAAKMRPSKSAKDMELSSLKKKFKDKKFAAGCSRDVIRAGADLLGWDLDQLLDGLTLSKLQKIFESVMKRREDKIDPVRSTFGTIKKEPVSLEEKIEAVLEYAERHRRFSFRGMLSRQRDKTEIVVTFLALLELMKMGRIHLTQEHLFDDMMIEALEPEETRDQTGTRAEEIG